MSYKGYFQFFVYIQIYLEMKSFVVLMWIYESMYVPFSKLVVFLIWEELLIHP